MYYVYVLHSQKDGQLYTGYTSDLKRRLMEHSAGKTASLVYRLPVKLIYYEAYVDVADAKGRELFLKSGSGKTYLKKQLKNYFLKNPWIT